MKRASLFRKKLIVSMSHVTFDQDLKNYFWSNMKIQNKISFLKTYNKTYFKKLLKNSQIKRLKFDLNHLQ